jgi:hypothetical protein
MYRKASAIGRRRWADQNLTADNTDQNGFSLMGERLVQKRRMCRKASAIGRDDGQIKTLPLMTLIERIFTDRRAAGTKERRMYRKASTIGQDRIQRKCTSRADQNLTTDNTDQTDFH